MAETSPACNAGTDMGKVVMALSFTPKYHVQLEAGRWRRQVNHLAPFGRYPSMESEREAFAEADKIEAEGERVVVIDFKPN